MCAWCVCLSLCVKNNEMNIMCRCKALATNHNRKMVNIAYTTNLKWISLSSAKNLKKCAHSSWVCACVWTSSATKPCWVSYWPDALGIWLALCVCLIPSEAHRWSEKSERNEEKKWISFEPSKILIWAAKAIPYGVCACVRASRFHPYGMTEMPCLGIEWKIRIIFSDTTSYVYKLYSVYFVSVCRFDIWQEFNRARFSLSLTRKHTPFAHTRTVFIVRSLAFHSAIQFSYRRPTKQNNDLSKCIWMNRIWVDCCASVCVHKTYYGFCLWWGKIALRSYSAFVENIFEIVSKKCV